MIEGIGWAILEERGIVRLTSYHDRYDFVPGVLNYKHIDTWQKINDDEAFGTAREVIRTEALLVGGSSGSAVSGALKYLKTKEGSERFGNVLGKNVVVMLPDG